MLLTLQKSKEQVNIYNIGSEDQTTVTEIAKIITQEMGMKNVEFKFTGGVDGGRGWVGDVKNMLLDISKLKTHGWRPKNNSEQAIKKTVRTFTRKRFKRLI
jgi:UDP-glucose 4-epimerase